jgi:hypothetical protein
LPIETSYLENNRKLSVTGSRVLNSNGNRVPFILGYLISISGFARLPSFLRLEEILSNRLIPFREEEGWSDTHVILMINQGLMQRMKQRHCRPRAEPEPRTPVSSRLHPYPVEFIAAKLIRTKTTISDPLALQVNLYELFDDRSFAGLLILQFEMVDERSSALGIG